MMRRIHDLFMFSFEGGEACHGGFEGDVGGHCDISNCDESDVNYGLWGNDASGLQIEVCRFFLDVLPLWC
jgi:hypothetical protein